MKKLISIIAFLLFFATSFHSYSLSEPKSKNPTFEQEWASCMYYLEKLEIMENIINRFYWKIAEQNNDLVTDLEIIKNVDNFVIWPIVSKEINIRLKSTLKLPLLNTEISIERNIYRFKKQFRKIYVKNNPLDIIESYETLRFIIRELQLIIIKHDPEACDDGIVIINE